VSGAVSIDANPGVDRPETASQAPLSPDTPTYRLIRGEYTIDVLPALVEGCRVQLFVGTGELGVPPTRLTIPVGFLPQLAAWASIVRARRVIDTAAWTSPMVSING